MVVHFPIALLIVGFLFASLMMFCPCCRSKSKSSVKPDSLDNHADSDASLTQDSCQTDDLSKCRCRTNCIEPFAFWLLTLGALSAVAAVLTGAIFTKDMIGPLGELRTTHEFLAFTTMIVSLIAAAVYAYYMYKAKIRQVQVIAYSLYVVAVILVSITGHYGGLIVYMFK